MNVLLYSGPGTSAEGNVQALEALRYHLSPYYAVTLVTEKQILQEPWAASTALLVVPGGADLPYVKSLNGSGNALIKQYVKKGGRYLGLCAGAYYGSAQVEFEQGTDIEVTGPRELCFYKGTARGAAFKNFKYGSNEGAYAAQVKTSDGAEFKCYVNGGCVFIGEDNVEVLARFNEKVHVETPEESPAAVIYKKFGSGDVVLSSIHMEYTVSTLKNKDDLRQDVHDNIEADNKARNLFMRAVLQKMGLQVNDAATGAGLGVPKLTPLHLTQLNTHATPNIQQFVRNLSEIITNGNQIVDANDTFILSEPHEILNKEVGHEKPIAIYTEGLPETKSTPYFNHLDYYAFLDEEQAKMSVVPTGIGRLLMYGEVVTSTSTMIDRNPQFLKRLPHGFLAVGTQQVQGRGRGSNVWVNPAGVLAASGVIRVQAAALQQSLVFLQYLVSLAVVEAVKSFGPEYEKLDVRLKWPNDVYIAKDDGYAKIGGVIATCNFFDGEYVLVFGAGTNVDNTAPSTSINSCINAYNARTGSSLALIKQEALLAKIMVRIDEAMTIFLAQGFAPFENRYYETWLHSNKIVRLDQYSNARAVIKGITPDTGMLLVQEVDKLDRPTGATYELQPDGNSFDMLKGLIRKKE